MRSEECTSDMGEFLLLQSSKLRRLKFSVISNCSTRKDVSMVIVTEGTLKQKTQIKYLVSSVLIIFLNIVDLPQTTQLLKGGN